MSDELVGAGPGVVETELVRRTLPTIEESLRVDKIEVDKGGYRITKNVETRDQQVDELLEKHRVEIERRPINTAIADDAIPQPRQEGDTLIVPVVEEVLITVKRLVLVEEVRITRIKETHRESQTVPLRREEIVVERLVAEDSSKARSS